MNYDVTSADVAAVMTIEDLYPSGFVLENFGSDQAIVSEPVQEVETRMGVDGKMVAGYTPAPVQVQVTFEPVSPSVPYLRTLAQSQRSQKRPFRIGLSVRVRSTNKKHTFINGVLTNSPPMSSVGKTMQPMTFTFTFERVE